MFDTQLVMYDEDYRKILGVIQRLVRDANAKGVFVVDKNGQLIAEAGEVRGIDTTSLASLTAGNIAATGGIAKLLGEKEFPTQFHEGERDNIHITLVANRVILVVIFDDRSSLGLVRLRVKKAGDELTQIFEDLAQEGRDREPAARGEPLRRDHRRRHRQPVQRLTRDPCPSSTTASREINCKIVYYGPGLCGKTTNLQYIYKKTNPERRAR